MSGTGWRGKQTIHGQFEADLGRRYRIQQTMGKGMLAFETLGYSADSSNMTSISENELKSAQTQRGLHPARIGSLGPQEKLEGVVHPTTPNIFWFLGS